MKLFTRIPFGHDISCSEKACFVVPNQSTFSISTWEVVTLLMFDIPPDLFKYRCYWQKNLMYLTFPPFPVRNSTLRAQPGLWRVSEAHHLSTQGEGKSCLGVKALMELSQVDVFWWRRRPSTWVLWRGASQVKHAQMCFFLHRILHILNTLSGGKVAREKCAKLRRISGSSLDNHFVHIIRSIPHKWIKGTNYIHSPSGHRGKLNTVCHDCT